VSVKKNVVANYLGQGWTALMGLAFVPVYIRYMGIEAYGLIGILALLQTWLSLLDMGMTPTLSREMASYTGGVRGAQSIRDLLRSIEILGVAVAITVALGIWMLSRRFATEWLHVEKIPIDVVAQALSIMGIVMALRFLENIYRSSIVGLQKQVMLNTVTSAMATIRGLGAVGVLVWIQPTIKAFFIWQGIVSLATTALFATVVYRELPRGDSPARLSVAALADVWRFAAGTLTITLLGFVLSQTDKLILSSLLTLEEFGQYTLAFAVASAIRLLAQPVDQAIFPKLTELHQQGNAGLLASTYHKANQFTVVLMGSAGAFVAIFGNSLLVIWTQDSVLAAATYPIMSILVIGMVMNGLMNGPYYLQMAAGWTGLLVRVNIVMVIIFVPLVIWFTIEYRAIGAALAWCLLNLIYLLVVARFMHRRLLKDEMWNWYWKDIVFPLFPAIVVSAFAHQLLPKGGSNFVSAVYLCACFVLILLSSSLASEHVRAAFLPKICGLLRK